MRKLSALVLICLLLVGCSNESGKIYYITSYELKEDGTSTKTVCDGNYLYDIIDMYNTLTNKRLSKYSSIEEAIFFSSDDEQIGTAVKLSDVEYAMSYQYVCKLYKTLIDNYAYKEYKAIYTSEYADSYLTDGSNRIRIIYPKKGNTIIMFENSEKIISTVPYINEKGDIEIK